MIRITILFIIIDITTSHVSKYEKVGLLALMNVLFLHSSSIYWLYNTYILHVQNEKNGENKDDTNSKGKSSSGELGEQENFMVKGRPASEVSQSHDHQAQFPDIIDLAEMDYSPAKRKPPIHNWVLGI